MLRKLSCLLPSKEDGEEEEEKEGSGFEERASHKDSLRPSPSLLRPFSLAPLHMMVFVVSAQG